MMDAFVRVVDAGSFSKAAASLRTTQPTLSKGVAQLERRLGVQLLLRSTHGLTPTEAGAAYYKRARDTLDAAFSADEAARGAASGFTGRLRVAAPVTFGRLHIIPHLPRFLAQHPDLTIDLLLDDRNIDLVADGLDIGLRMGDLAHLTLLAHRIGRAQRRAFAATSFFSPRGEPMHPSQLGEHDAILYARGEGGAVWTFSRGEQSVQVTTKSRICVSVAEGMREAVLAGLGFAIASEWMFADLVSAGMVQPFLTEWTLPPLDFWAVYPSRQPSPKARAFAEMVASAMLVQSRKA